LVLLVVLGGAVLNSTKQQQQQQQQQQQAQHPIVTTTATTIHETAGRFQKKQKTWIMMKQKIWNRTRLIIKRKSANSCNTNNKNKNGGCLSSTNPSRFRYNHNKNFAWFKRSPALAVLPHEKDNDNDDSLTFYDSSSSSSNNTVFRFKRFRYNLRNFWNKKAVKVVRRYYQEWNNYVWNLSRIAHQGHRRSMSLALLRWHQQHYHQPLHQQ